MHGFHIISFTGEVRGWAEMAMIEETEFYRVFSHTWVSLCTGLTSLVAIAG